MHKSAAITFGLLMSSLVMLVLVPFYQQQQNIFSNVMAQEYTNDNSYGYNSYSNIQLMIKNMNVEHGQ